MKGKKVLFTLMAVALLVLPTVMAASAAEPGDPDTKVEVTDASFRCRETGTSQILVSIANDPSEPRLLHGVEVHLSFDATQLQVVDADGDPNNGVQIAAEGGLFPLAEQVVVQAVDNAAGTILFAVSRKNEAGVQDATDAAIATITWEAADGVCPVTAEVWSDVNGVDALMSDADGYAIAVDEKLPGTVCILPPLDGCITGYVKPQGRYPDPDRPDNYSGATVTAEKDGVVVASATTDPYGYFKLEGLEAGTYEVTAEMGGYLVSWKGSGVEVVAGACTDIGATKLLGGDVAPQPTGDNVIDIGDITYIASRFGEPDTPADINGDGVVNILDLTMTAANFTTTGPTPWAE